MQMAAFWMLTQLLSQGAWFDMGACVEVWLDMGAWLGGGGMACRGGVA